MHGQTREKCITDFKTLIWIPAKSLTWVPMSGMFMPPGSLDLQSLNMSNEEVVCKLEWSSLETSRNRSFIQAPVC